MSVQAHTGIIHSEDDEFVAMGLGSHVIVNETDYIVETDRQAMERVVLENAKIYWLVQDHTQLVSTTRAVRND